MHQFYFTYFFYGEIDLFHFTSFMVWTTIFLNFLGNFTFFFICRSNAEKPLINALQKTDELPQQKSLLGELPPLMGPQSSTVKNPALSLAPLKKVPPPVAKVEGTKKEDLIKTAKPALEVRPMSKSIENERSVCLQSIFLYFFSFSILQKFLT